MPGQTFSEWLNDRVGDSPGRVSRSELARRLAHKHPDDGERLQRVESQRRNLHKILAGQKAQQSTRDAICDALGVPRESAPSAKDEEAEEDSLRHQSVDEFLADIARLSATAEAIKRGEIRLTAETVA